MAIKVTDLTEIPSPILATDTIYVVRGGVSYKATGTNIPFSGQPKVYKALLTQSGTSAPVATVLVNTLSGTPIWSRTGVGQYSLTLAGQFPADKLYIAGFSDWTDGVSTVCIPIIAAGGSLVGYYLLSCDTSPNSIYLSTLSPTFLPVEFNTLLAASRLSLPTIEVYP